MVTSTEDATTLLRKEHRLLTKIAHLHVAPQPIDLFQDWEHVFLVQELITGENLTAFCARKNVTLLPKATKEDTERYYRQFRQIFLQLASTLDRLHAHGIVFADLSPSNLIIDPETMKLTILDFEAAVETGVDRPVQLFTEGFTFIDQAQGKPSTMQSDYFAMGAIMHHALWPINQMFMISPRSRHTFIASVVKDIGFPSSIRDLVAGLLDRDADKRPTPADVIGVLERDDEVSEPWTTLDTWSPEDPELTASLRDTVRDIVRYISASADYSRRDRLVPADGSVFRTNPLSVAYGACGVAYVLHRVGADTAPFVDWIRAARVNAELYPPGLYVGLSGVAWTLLALGVVEQAARAMNMVYAHPLRTSERDLFEGAAGIGLASLRFFAATQDERHLTEAIAAGRYLLQARTEDETGCYWLREAERPLGLAHGASGIALFLLYLTLASGDEEFLEVGRRALASELREGVINDSVISWPRLANRRHILYPYWRFGSAGVGTALLRYHRVLGTPIDPTVMDRILDDTNRKYAIFPGYFAGLSGLGEFLLDAHAHTGERRFLEGAYRVASGLTLFRIEKPTGLAFPGETLRRISCDYGTGSAGVAHFLHRLTHREIPSAFLLDDLFDATRTIDTALVTHADA